MSDINAHESGCLSCWTAVKKYTQTTLKGVIRWMRAFFTKQHACVKQLPSNAELILRVEQANKLVQELNDRKKELKAAIFGNQLLSFIPSGHTSLGKLVYITMQLPFKTLGINNTYLKPIDIRAAYDFVVPLEDGQLIVTFKSHGLNDETHISCYGRLPRSIASDMLECRLKRENVAPCAPDQFVVCHESDTFRLSVYNSSLQCVRSVECKDFSNICCNSKFVFGLWDTYSSSQRIQVRHLDTLSKAFGLVAAEKHTMERIVADEHHVVAMSRLASEPHSGQWYMSIFDLVACNRARQKFAPSKHVLLDLGRPCFFTDSAFLSKVFLFDGWLVVPRENAKELFWFDKNGTRSETRTRLDSNNMNKLYAYGRIIILTSNDGKLYFQR